ncbi:hypothetical protein ACN94T_002606 [Acinetobacter baumannii]
MSMGLTFVIAVLIIYAISITILLIIAHRALKKLSNLTKPEEPKTLYDWTRVPDWVQWIATGSEGFGFGYEHKPKAGWMHRGFWYDGGKDIFLIWPDENPYKGEQWRESLEERPKVIP